jgi:hypothetical protein
MITINLLIGCELKNRRYNMPINTEFEVKGKPLKDASAEHQIIAILTKKLGGEVLFSLKEADKITGFCMQVTPQGKILLKAS